MNGKHPIDDLFARGLRDAEATPPPAVWEGIVRERAKARPSPAEKPVLSKDRGRWGLAALLMLLLGAAGYLLVAQEDPAQDGPASARSSSGAKEQTATGHPDAVSTSSTSDNTNEDRLSAATPNRVQGPEERASYASPSADTAGRPAGVTGESTVQAQNGTGSAKHTARRTHGSKEREANSGDPTTASSITAQYTKRGSGAVDDGRKTDGALTSWPAGDAQDGPSEGDAGAFRDKRAGRSGLEGPDRMEQVVSSTSGRAVSEVHLPTLEFVVTQYMNSVAPVPGSLLRGDSTPAYVHDKGQWWVAAQAEWAGLNGDWNGTGPEVNALNASETWRGQNGFSIVFGRSWSDRWSVGMGMGITKQRSRFLRHEVEEGRTETVVDTTWTATAMGTQTNYTWDIVETLVEEPGVERDLNATNTYTRLRIAPELGIELLGRKRATLSARVAPTMMFDLGRKGSTVATVSTMDSLETLTPALATRSLGDASFDKRFQAAFALSLSLEARYQLHERWAVSLLPTYTYWLPRAESTVPALSMTELGGAVRLRYDFRHWERRVK
jgi:hypothetical protein